MDFIHRRRFFLWLIRAYIKRRTKIFLIFFAIGGVLFFLISQNLSLVKSVLNISEPWRVGIVGSYSLEALPQEVQDKLSVGLTKIDPSGKAIPSAAQRWEVQNDEKTYIFHLRQDLAFQDGQRFKASDVNYNFKEATITQIDPNTVRFQLSEPFSPLPTVVSRPIFKKGLVGLGDFKVTKTERNGSFVKSIMLSERKNPAHKTHYKFYPSESAVKTAFMLGEVDEIKVSNISELKDWSTISLEKQEGNEDIVVLFYNTTDNQLTSKQLRQGLTYAIPDTINGEDVKGNSSLRLNSWAFKEQPEKFRHNKEQARKLLGEPASDSAKLSLTITTTLRLEQVAKEIQKAWEDTGVETQIEVTENFPSEFQVLLRTIHIPPDPDQYNLWHSTQSTNITHYGSQRIDKLLEDGRKTVDEERRKIIYEDFQKYLVDDAPAAFLYYPDVYTVKRK